MAKEAVVVEAKKEGEEVEEVEVEEVEETEGDEKTDWKKEARKHERRVKAERKEREAAEARLKELETADQSEHEKALEAARAEGEKSAREAGDKDRKSDRLEVATTRLATKGLKVEDAIIQFADPDDAILHLERAISRGDIDEDEIFDDKGKVSLSALTDALTELLVSKPHLGASPQDNSRKVKGSADAGKGSSAGKDLEDLSVEEHLARIQKKR